MDIALIYGLNYKGSGSDLAGCEADADNWAALFKKYGVETLVRKGRYSAADLEKDLAALKVGRSKSDRTWLVGSGHGTQVGSALESDGEQEAICLWDGRWFEAMTDRTLRARLESIPGKVFCILDTCFSGGMDRAAIPAGSSRKFFTGPVGHIVDEARLRSAKPPGDLCYLSACAEGETAVDLGPTGGLFTVSVMEHFRRNPEFNRVPAVLKTARALCRPHQHPGCWPKTTTRKLVGFGSL